MNACAGRAKTDGVSSREGGVIRLQPEMESEPAHERADRVAIAFSVRPNPLKALCELRFFVMCFMPEHNVLSTDIDTGRGKKIP